MNFRRIYSGTSRRVPKSKRKRIGESLVLWMCLKYSDTDFRNFFVYCTGTFESDDIAFSIKRPWTKFRHNIIDNLIYNMYRICSFWFCASSFQNSYSRTPYSWVSIPMRFLTRSFPRRCSNIFVDFLCRFQPVISSGITK